MFKKYYNEIRALMKESYINHESDFIPTIVRLPDVIKQEKEEANIEDWLLIKNLINATVDKLDEFRANEGAITEKDIISRINIISNLLTQTAPYEAERITTLKQKLYNNLINHVTKDKVDNNRFEQEIIYYLEKIDINEEKTRLKKHCEYFIDTANEPVSNGRKLTFISQEIGREINTLGAKANEFNMQKLVVQMKDELEKIKEQLANIL